MKYYVPVTVDDTHYVYFDGAVNHSKNKIKFMLYLTQLDSKPLTTSQWSSLQATNVHKQWVHLQYTQWLHQM